MEADVCDGRTVIIKRSRHVPRGPVFQVSIAVFGSVRLHLFNVGQLHRGISRARNHPLAVRRESSAANRALVGCEILGGESVAETIGRPLFLALKVEPSGSRAKGKERILLWPWLVLSSAFQLFDASLGSEFVEPLRGGLLSPWNERRIRQLVRDVGEAIFVQLTGGAMVVGSSS